MPSRDLGVQVLARLRPWLATLLAISANSPIEASRDTGHASRRYGVVARWPTGRPPSTWPDGAHYDATVRRLIHHGAALDEGSIYFLARLSPHYPTVEVRVADVCPDVDTALLVAASFGHSSRPLSPMCSDLIVIGRSDVSRTGRSGVRR